MSVRHSLPWPLADQVCYGGSSIRQECSRLDICLIQLDHVHWESHCVPSDFLGQWRSDTGVLGMFDRVAEWVAPRGARSWLPPYSISTVPEPCSLSRVTNLSFFHICSRFSALLASLVRFLLLPVKLRGGKQTSNYLSFWIRWLWSCVYCHEK